MCFDPSSTSLHFSANCFFALSAFRPYWKAQNRVHFISQLENFDRSQFIGRSQPNLQKWDRLWDMHHMQKAAITYQHFWNSVIHDQTQQFCGVCCFVRACWLSRTGGEPWKSSHFLCALFTETLFSFTISLCILLPCRFVFRLFQTVRSFFSSFEERNARASKVPPHKFPWKAFILWCVGGVISSRGWQHRLSEAELR